MEAIKQYKKGADYSYALGAFPTIELLKCKPECVQEVFIHPSFSDRELIESLCNNHGIRLTESCKMIEKLSDKENVFVVGVFSKYTSELSGETPHIVLVQPSNMGNLGTIIRTSVGFGIHDLAIIQPGADIFNPKVIRASMGALFHLRFHYYEDFTAYGSDFSNHYCYPFMLNGEKLLGSGISGHPRLYSLIFGNEATGLPDSFRKIGTSVMIPQSSDVDSLNITIAVAVATYLFTLQTEK